MKKTTKEYFFDRIDELVRDFQIEVDRIKQDGVIDYQEAVTGERFASAFQTELQALRDEADAGMNTIRVDFNRKVLAANALPDEDAQAREIERLNMQRQYALRPYELALQLIDTLLVSAANNRSAFEQVIGQVKSLQVDGMSVTDAYEAAAQHISTMRSPLKQQLNNTPRSMPDSDLRGLHSKWSSMLHDLDERLNSPDQNAEQIAYLKGAKKAMQVALNDLSALLSKTDNA